MGVIKQAIGLHNLKTLTMSQIDDFQTVLDVVKLIDIVQKIDKIKKKRKKKCWVKPWIARRELPGRGTLSLLHNELAEEDPERYKNFLRMNEETFNKLLAMLHSSITKKDTNMRQAVSSRDRLAITLRFLATGETYASLSTSLRVPACTISLIVPQVCKAIYDVLKEEYLKVCPYIF